MKAVPVAIALCLLGVVLFYATTSKNNVCKTFGDYYTDRDGNANCYYNPEYRLETPEIIKRRGYRVETHEVITEDGYVLTLYRIPPPEGASGKPVFLQHGYASNSAVFVLIGEKSLAFILAKQGYDVWLANSRGTTHSRSHTNPSISDEDYHAFSFDELGLYDLPAALSYVRDLSKQKITYIGISLGTLVMYIYGISYPEEARSNVEMFVNLAPSVFIENRGVALDFAVSHWEYIEPILRTAFNTRELLKTVLVPLARLVCFPFPFQMRTCLLPLMLMFGFNYGQHDPETLPIMLMHSSESPSLKIFTHGVQLAQSGILSRFSHGKKTNTKSYGSERAPAYNFSKMNVPTYLLRARNDKVATKHSVDALYRALPKEVTSHGIYEVDDDEFSHTDFLFGKDVLELVYNHLVDFLKAL